MADELDPVVQQFIADMSEYLAAIEDAVRDARDFAEANLEAKAAIDEMRDSAAEAGGADHELSAEAKDARDALLEEAAAAHEASSEMGDLRDSAAEAAAAVGAEGAASLGASAASTAGILDSVGTPAIIALVAALALGLAALFPVLAVLPLIGIGIAGFAAVAVPEISKVWTALGQGGAAWAKLSPQEKAAGRELRDLRGEFHQLSKAVQPEILTAFDEAARVLKDLMPAIRPLIIAAGKALDTFLGQIDAWLKSGSGQKFIHWMKVDGVGAIKAFGEFLWGLTQVLGRTFSFLFNFGETVHRVFDRVRHDVATWADDAHHDFDLVRHTIASWGHDIAHDFDAVRAKVHEFFTYIGAHLTPFTEFWRSHWGEIKQVLKAAWDVIVTNVKVALAIMITVIKVALMVIVPFVKAALVILESAWHVAWAIMGAVLKTAWQVWTELVSGAIHLILNIIAVVLDLITGHWSKAWHDMEKLVSDALHTIISIIKSLTSGFGTLLFDAGRALVTGLINGIKSMFGALGSVASSIGHFIAGLKGPLPHDLTLLVPHGQAIMQGLMNGMTSQLPALRGLLGSVTAGIGAPGVPALAAAGTAAGARGVAGGAGATVINLGGITVNGWVGNDQQLALKIQDAILRHGNVNPSTGTWPFAKGRIR